MICIQVSYTAQGVYESKYQHFIVKFDFFFKVCNTYNVGKIQSILPLLCIASKAGWAIDCHKCYKYKQHQSSSLHAEKVISNSCVQISKTYLCQKRLVEHATLCIASKVSWAIDCQKCYKYKQHQSSKLQQKGLYPIPVSNSISLKKLFVLEKISRASYLVYSKQSRLSESTVTNVTNMNSIRVFPHSRRG